MKIEKPTSIIEEMIEIQRIIDSCKYRLGELILQQGEMESFKHPDYEPLPEGVKFYYQSGKLMYSFGNKQVIYFDPSFDYGVFEFYSVSDAVNNCHLEPCKMGDLQAGDWFCDSETNLISLFVTPDKCFTPHLSGDISRHVYSLTKEIKKIVYENTK